MLGSSEVVPQTTDCLAKFVNGQLYLFPVDKVVSMRTVLEHVDAERKARAIVKEDLVKKSTSSRRKIKEGEEQQAHVRSLAKYELNSPESDNTATYMKEYLADDTREIETSLTKEQYIAKLCSP